MAINLKFLNKKNGNIIVGEDLTVSIDSEGNNEDYTIQITSKTQNPKPESTFSFSFTNGEFTITEVRNRFSKIFNDINNHRFEKGKRNSSGKITFDLVDAQFPDEFDFKIKIGDTAENENNTKTQTLTIFDELEFEKQFIAPTKSDEFSIDSAQINVGKVGSVRMNRNDKSPTEVVLVEAGRNKTQDQFLWIYIRNGVLDFKRYKKFIDMVLSDPNSLPEDRDAFSKKLPYSQVEAYSILKFATDFYMDKFYNFKFNEETDFDNTIIRKSSSEKFALEDEKNRTKIPYKELRDTIYGDNNSNNAKSYWVNGKNYLPYFTSILDRLEPFKLSNMDTSWGNDTINSDLIHNINLLELIWSYWHEEGGLVQTMNAISLRFQNVRTGRNDPLAGLNIDPLRPINNLVWGYIEDERNRLSMARRNLEYQYEYGISLIGPAVPVVQVAESRSQFLPAFHNLLKTAIDFYQQANYTTVIPDGFPVLNSLREVHMLLAEGAHNQFGSLPWTARSEMLMQQWLLARPEMREFLGGRIMIPYQEPWMDKVDTMKTIQSWNPTNISHFHDLGAFGEQLLLSIRYGDWNNSTKTRDEAANWAYYWREEIQRYVHAYKAATGVDLGNDVTDARIAMPQNVERYTQPSVLIGRRVNSLPNNRPSQLNRLTQRRNIERY